MTSFFLFTYIRYINIESVLLKPTSIVVRPRWTVEPTDKQFAQGSDAKVDCKADGFPQPKISWRKAVGEWGNLKSSRNGSLG